jgi:16S rRNA (guanine966-N2)-methyltransferase
MRIIAGEFRSRRLFTPEDDTAARPIPDRVKESLFNILRGHTEGSVFDGFAGTGAIGLEALSRGARSCVFVERDKDMVKLLNANIEMLGAQERCEVVHGDALGFGALARCPRPLKLAFLDPPYALVREPIGFQRVMAQLGKLVDLLQPDGYACLRTPWPLWLEESPPAVEAPRPRRRKTRGGPRRPPPGGWAEWVEVKEGEDPAAALAAAAPPEPAAHAPDNPNRTKPDLSLKNAVGPETHEYTSMAIHLYMKKQE